MYAYGGGGGGNWCGEEEEKHKKKTPAPCMGAGKQMPRTKVVGVAQEAPTPRSTRLSPSLACSAPAAVPVSVRVDGARTGCGEHESVQPEESGP